MSNVDTALLVTGLVDLDFNPRRLGALPGTGGWQRHAAVVVLTKHDMAAAAQPAAQLAPYLVPGQTLVLLESSGAGKSTLTNALMGQAVQDTSAAREHDSRGKHTTTARSLLCLPGGACIIDTPGVRTLRPEGDEHSVAAVFKDIAALAAQCRFRDCLHEDEPACAVRARAPPDRLRNYHKLRREEVARWKVRYKAAATCVRIKQGEGRAERLWALHGIPAAYRATAPSGLPAPVASLRNSIQPKLRSSVTSLATGAAASSEPHSAASARRVTRSVWVQGRWSA